MPPLEYAEEYREKEIILAKNFEVVQKRAEKEILRCSRHTINARRRAENGYMHKTAGVAISEAGNGGFQSTNNR